MKEKIKKICIAIKKIILDNRVWLPIPVFLFVIFFIGEFNMVGYLGKMSRLRELRENAEHYKVEIQENKSKLKEIFSGKEDLEKFAREQYYMKEDDEDVFVVIIEEED